jgi:hypothetical protein
MTLVSNQRLQEIGMKCLAIFFALLVGGGSLIGMCVNVLDGLYLNAVLAAIMLPIVFFFARLLWTTGSADLVDNQERTPAENGDSDRSDCVTAAFVLGALCLGMVVTDILMPYRGLDQRSLLLSAIVIAALGAAATIGYVSKKTYDSFVFGSFGYGIFAFVGIGLIYLGKIVLHVY